MDFFFTLDCCQVFNTAFLISWSSEVKYGHCLTNYSSLLSESQYSGQQALQSFLGSSNLQFFVNLQSLSDSLKAALEKVDMKKNLRLLDTRYIWIHHPKHNDKNTIFTFVVFLFCFMFCSTNSFFVFVLVSLTLHFFLKYYNLIKQDILYNPFLNWISLDLNQKLQ